jgi:hypothetical protein
MNELPGILLLESKIPCDELRRLVQLYFGDMVKYVVDVRRRIAAIGGELHADAEQILLERGSHQGDLWEANYYPGLGPEKARKVHRIHGLDQHSTFARQPQHGSSR